MGRPTKCTKDIAGSICTSLAEGESLRSVCISEEMPTKSTVLLWVVQGRVIEGTDKIFSDQYHDAREAAGYSHADEALAIRHELREGTLDYQTAKVILDALKWGAERMAPKRHASRQELAHSNPDGSMTPTVIERRVIDPDGSS